MKRVCDNVSELYFAEVRKNPKLSMARLCEELDAGAGSVNRWINRKNDPQAAYIPRIAKRFNVPLDRLFEGVE